MNRRLNKSKTPKRNMSCNSQFQKVVCLDITDKSNNEAILRLCDNIFFMAQDCIFHEGESPKHKYECED